MTQTINGTPGIDTLTGTNPGNPANLDGIDIINGLAGNDTLSGLGGDDTLKGGAGRRHPEWRRRCRHGRLPGLGIGRCHPAER